MRNRLPAGEMIGPYRIVGATANGYHAVLATEGDPVVITVWSDDAEAKITRALRLFGSLDHPGVAPLLAQGVFADGQLWLAAVQPLGPVLHDALMGRTFRADKVATLVRDAADVLRYVHWRGLVHGNLHPLSISMTESEHSVSIGDWGDIGEARPLGVFDPPGAQPDEPSNDVFALGVIAYRALTGRFPQPHVVAVPGAPPALAQLIVEMMAQNADDRPTAQEARDAVCRMLGQDMRAVEITVERADEEPTHVKPRFATPRWTPTTHMIPPIRTVLPVTIDEDFE